MSEASSFVRLAGINLNEHVEKKAGLTYLSWSWAVDKLLREDPSATWEYRFFGDLPYQSLPDGTAMVFCTVTAFGQSRTMQLPIMDNRNRPISNPDSFSLNTAMQRCLVKAISLTGLGLYLYKNEDVPDGEASNDSTSSEQSDPQTNPQPKANVTSLPNESKASLAQIRYIEQLLEKTGTAKERLLEFFQVTHLAALTVSAASRAIKSLEKQRRAA